MTLRHTLLGCLLGTIALVPIGAQAQRYTEVYRSPPVVYEPAPPVEVARYWDSDRGVWVERRIIEDRPSMHWVPERRIIQPDGSVYIQGGHWEYDR
jgi:hypothetical protein